MYEYKIKLIFKYGLPGLNVVVTNIGDEDHTVTYESHQDSFNVYFRVFTDEEISKRLNILNNNIENNKKLSEIEVLDFAYVLLFAQEKKAKEYSEKIAELFKKVKNLDFDQQLEIHYILKKLIRLHFRDDLKKTIELLTMITKAVHPDVLDGMTTLEKAQHTIEIKDSVISQMGDELSQKDNKISQMGDELSQKDNKISQMGDELSQKDNRISQMDKELKKLKEKLKENNIEVD